MNNLPPVMKNARTDLSANVSGQFSPDDWERILTTAHEKFLVHQATGLAELKAWEQVMLDFYHHRYWGFEPNYRVAKDPKRRTHLGISFIFFTLLSMTATKMALAWLGQRYTASDEPRDAYIFFAALAIVVGSFVFFLWRTRHHKSS